MLKEYPAYKGLDARPLDDGGINDQLIKRHLLID